MNVDKNSVARFTDRVADYIRYRPSYPIEALDSIQSIGELRRGAKVVDLGSGTGIWTRILLNAGFHVTAIEPNLEPVPKRMILRSENSSAGWARATAAEEHSNSENLIHLVL